MSLKDTWYKITHTKQSRRDVYFLPKGVFLTRKFYQNKIKKQPIYLYSKNKETIGIAQKNMMETPIDKHPTATHGLNRSPVSNINHNSDSMSYVSL